MIRFILLSLIVSFVGCSQSTNPLLPTEEEPEPIQKAWTKPVVDGEWELVYAKSVKDIPFLGIYNDSSVFSVPNRLGGYDENGEVIGVYENIEEEYYSSPRDCSNSLIFKNDSIYYLDFPFEMMYQSTYTLDSGYLHIKTSSRDYHFQSKTPIEYINDTLYLYMKKPPYLKVGYIQHDLDDSIVYQLKKYGMNYPELSGTWILLRNYWEGYGYYYELDFPYTVPDSIHLTKEELIALQDNDRIYKMRTNGRMRDYTLSYHPPFLYLTPNSWCKPEEKEGYNIEHCDILKFNHSTDYPSAGIYSCNIPDEENHMKEE